MSPRPKTHLTQAEKRFVRWHNKLFPNDKIYRPNWPDFLVEEEHGGFYLVEVKARCRPVRANDPMGRDYRQRSTLTLLANHGLQCLVVSMSAKDEPVKDGIVHVMPGGYHVPNDTLKLILGARSEQQARRDRLEKLWKETRA